MADLLSDDDTGQQWNCIMLAIAAIIKNILLLVSEAELAALYECTKAMVPLHQSLLEMG